jgi:enoyl-CoA hydratase/carnithine racemase
VRVTAERVTATPGGVRLEIDGGVGVLLIDRPEVRNAIGFATVAEVGDALDAAAAADVAVLVLRGGGDRAFVSGGDLKELDAVRTHADAVAMARQVRALLDRIAEFPVPVIAALNGHALGGGAEVAVAADIRIAADDVRIGFNQVSLGIMPAWGGAERLSQIVGRGRALLAVSTGRLFDAATAQQWGLVDEVVPRTSFDEHWRTIARQIADLAPGTSRAVKNVIGAAAPAAHPELAESASHEFARLWAADAHWSAVDAMLARRKSN